MKLNAVKVVKPKKNLLKRILAVAGSVVVFVVCLLVLNYVRGETEQYVAVIRVKAADGIPAGKTIAEGDVEVYNIIKKEYSSDMVTLSEELSLDGFINQAPYLNCFLRKNRVLFSADLGNEKVSSLPYIDYMSDEEELLTVPYDYREASGYILMPGDRINIRAIYLDSGEEIVEDLFSGIVVADMLNKSSESIYEKYMDVINLPENKRQEQLNNQDFVKSITPAALQLIVTEDQVIAYAKYGSRRSSAKSMVITLLSRANSNIIIDQLPAIRNEVNSWREQ